MIHSSLLRGVLRVCLPFSLMMTVLALTACDDSSSLAHIEITPVTASAAAGTSVQFSATAIYTNNTHSDITTQVQWSTSDASVATIGANTGRATAMTEGAATITAAFSGKTASATLTATAATLKSIAVSPPTSSIAAGTSQAFQAMGTFSDNSSQDITQDVSWSSSNTAVATVGASTGQATAIASGTATVTASLSGNAAAATLTVTPALLVSLVVTPPIASIAAGTSQALEAEGTFSDNTTQDISGDVTWTSSNTAAVTVASNGVATGVSTGMSTITAACTNSSVCGSISATATVTVTAAVLQSITITPASATVGTWQTLQFTATGTYSDSSTQDITSQVNWASGNTSVITISNASPFNGLASGIAAGSANITAVLGSVTSSAVTANAANLTTTLTASVSDLVLSVTGLTLGSTASGQARAITITNTGTLAATNVTVSSSSLPQGTVMTSTCGSTLSAGSSCRLSVTPGATPSAAAGNVSPTPATLSVAGSNTNSINVSVSVLTYGSVYQGGYLFAIDDSTATTGSIGGQVAALADQVSSVPWGDLLVTIYGIDETSTNVSPQPNSGQVAGQVACNGATDGACNSANIAAYEAATSSTGFAAAGCATPISGYVDWYLPAVCQMTYQGPGCGSSSAPIVQNVQSSLVDNGDIGAIDSAVHWSSTEDSANPDGGAWLILPNGSTFEASKNDAVNVRCVRNVSP
jgi:uncharacterized protein YjdB